MQGEAVRLAKYVSIHAPREGCDTSWPLVSAVVMVSIHAPREGCDDTTKLTTTAGQVSIHAPREGCDHCGSYLTRLTNSFNSRTPGGVRPKAGEDAMEGWHKFQFTHPGRGATHGDARGSPVTPVSIHAPREGCDLHLQRPSPSPRSCFNSRTPGGVRHIYGGIHRILRGFNSRTPGGVRRAGSEAQGVGGEVSIHAPREGCDYWLANVALFVVVFQFTHPGRGATRSALRTCPAVLGFNSRTPGGVRRFPHTGA